MDNLHLRLFKMERLTLRAGAWNARDVRSAFWRFYWNQNDGAWLELDGGPYPLHGGRPYLVPAGIHFHCRNRVNVDHFYIHFDVIGLPRIALQELFQDPICLPSQGEFRAAIQEWVQMLSEVRPMDLARQCQVKGMLYQGLASSLSQVEPERLARCSQWTAALGPVLPAIHFIEGHLGDSLPNSLLAEICHLSKEHFIRRFHVLVGQPPAQYISEQRVTLAAQRLLFTDQSIEQIADACGYGSRSYFSRAFTRQMGIAPAAFRKSKHI